MDKIDKLIQIIRTLKEEGGMVAGAGGFTGSADPKGPVAGYDPLMQFDGRSSMARRLPSLYRSDLINKKRTKKKKNRKS